MSRNLLTFGCTSLGKDWTIHWNEKKKLIWNKAITVVHVVCPYLLLVIEMYSDSFSPCLSPPQTLKLMSMVWLSKSPQSVRDTARSTLFSLHFLSVDGNGIEKGRHAGLFHISMRQIGKLCSSNPEQNPSLFVSPLTFLRNGTKGIRPSLKRSDRLLLFLPLYEE